MSDWDLELLLARGYFPKELPPPFTTRRFAAICCDDSLGTPSVFSSTRPTRMGTHTLGLAGGRRRTLGIPNPTSQYLLAKEIKAGWSDLWARIDDSPYSLSKPKTVGSRALEPTIPFQDVPRERAPIRARGTTLLRMDVAQYYPSVYTHAIPWALHGKATAKRQRDNGLLGNRLDAALRATQDGQTVGIPIGPDTSLVIAELLLSRVDRTIYERFETPGTRHMDDYEFAVADMHTAERLRAGAQDALGDFELGPNTEKTNIVQLPQLLERPWLTELRHMPISNDADAQYYSIVRFHDRAVELARLYPTENVLKYALGRLDRLGLHAENLQLFLALILQFIAAEYGVMPNALPILERMKSHEELTDLTLVEEFLNAFILGRIHSRLNNDVAWGLWAAIRLECSLADETVQALSTVSDSVVCLVALDARERDLMQDSRPLRVWSDHATKASLSEKTWLLAYEASERGWLGKSKPASAHEAFSHLARHEVRFYDEPIETDGDIVTGHESTY